MITLERALEIFSDKKIFKKNRRENGIKFRQCVDMKTLSKDGNWHYDFIIKETNNRMATIDFGKWCPIDTKICCFDIADEDFLLSLIDMCKNGLI